MNQPPLNPKWSTQATGSWPAPWTRTRTSPSNSGKTTSLKWRKRSRSQSMTSSPPAGSRPFYEALAVNHLTSRWCAWRNPGSLFSLTRSWAIAGKASSRARSDKPYLTGNPSLIVIKLIVSCLCIKRKKSNKRRLFFPSSTINITRWSRQSSRSRESSSSSPWVTGRSTFPLKIVSMPKCFSSRMILTRITLRNALKIMPNNA